MGFFSNLFDSTTIKVVEHTTDSVAKAWNSFLEKDYNCKLDEFDIARQVASLRAKKYHMEYDTILSLNKEIIPRRYTTEDFVWLVLNIEMNVYKNELNKKTRIKWVNAIRNKLKEAGLYYEEPTKENVDFTKIKGLPKPFYKSK